MELKRTLEKKKTAMIRAQKRGIMEILSKNNLIPGNSVVYGTCWCVARPFDDDIFFSEQVSYLVFKILLWIPIGVLLCNPFWVSRMTTKTLEFLDCRVRQEEANAMTKREKAPNKSEEEVLLN
jgi:hypothetical protein